MLQPSEQQEVYPKGRGRMEWSHDEKVPQWGMLKLFTRRRTRLLFLFFLGYRGFHGHTEHAYLQEEAAATFGTGLWGIQKQVATCYKGSQRKGCGYRH